MENSIKKLPLKHILKDSWVYCLRHAKASLLFALAAYAAGALALFCWKSLFFLPVLGGIYVLWGASLRYYLGRKPYFSLPALTNSLIPSTKIVLLSVVVASVLILLPLLPLFLNLSPEFLSGYSRFLEGDFEQEQMLILAANIVFTLISPYIAYRPFLAWISALCGRSGSLRFAWSKTHSNYTGFLMMAVLTNLSISLLRWLILTLDGNDYATLLFAAPLVVYFNVAAAKIYEFFFLEID